MNASGNPVVFFDITIGGMPKGRFVLLNFKKQWLILLSSQADSFATFSTQRIEMELRADVVPKTAENFR